MPDKLRVLIADDSPNVRRELQDILGDEYDLIEAENGEQAWTMIGSDKGINMVFADLSMPELDGLSLLKKIRGNQDADLRSMPVVMMTEAADDMGHVKESLTSGVTDLVRKPFVPEVLRSRVDANIRLVKKSDTATASIDPLTQLANESYFMLRGVNNIAHANRHKLGFGILLISIDSFDDLQQQHEAYVIESVQVKVGTYINAVVRTEDTVARLGDGRYGVLLMGSNAQGVLEAADRIRHKVKKKVIRYNNRRFSITVSIGATAPILKAYSSFELLLRQASAELKKAVSRGGDCIEAENIYQRLAGEYEDSEYVPSLDEALEILNNNQGKLLTHCAQQLFDKLQPLLTFCDQHLKSASQSGVQQSAQDAGQG